MRYRNDPYWLTVRYAGTCANGKADHAHPYGILPGQRAFYYPNGKYLLCERCGEAAAREFALAAADEDAYNYGFSS